jgi:hypothetical protein
MSHRCPNQHASESADFCSVCGAEIGVAAAPTNQRSGVGDGEPCPSCGTLREHANQAFCEGCGHNFRTGTPGITLDPIDPEVPPAPPVPATAPPPTDVRWDVVLRVDANLYGKPNPDTPRDQPPQTFTLFEAENMVGREGTGLSLQVPIRNDPGVSRRQVLLIRQPDGGLVLRDLNSSNGTQVNGVEVVPGADVPLRDGDTIAVGAWTRIAVRAIIS